MPATAAGLLLLLGLCYTVASRELGEKVYCAMGYGYLVSFEEMSEKLIGERNGKNI